MPYCQFIRTGPTLHCRLTKYVTICPKCPGHCPLQCTGQAEQNIGPSDANCDSVIEFSIPWEALEHSFTLKVRGGMVVGPGDFSPKSKSCANVTFFCQTHLTLIAFLF